MNIKDLIVNLENFELAFLYKYRYNEFLRHTKSLIQKELRARNLGEDQLKAIINTKLQEPLKKDSEILQCPRCKSKKIFTYKLNVDRTSQSNVIDSLAGQGKVNVIKKAKCIICGQPIHNKKKWWLIDRFFN